MRLTMRIFKILVSVLLSILIVLSFSASGFAAVVSSVVDAGDEIEGVDINITKQEDRSGPDYPEISPLCSIGIKAIKDDSTEVKIKDEGSIPYGTYTSFEVILTDGSKPTSYAAFNNFYFKYIKVTMNSETSTKSFEYDSFTRSYNLLTNKTYAFNSDTTFSLEVEYSMPRYDLTFDANGGNGSYPTLNKYYGVGYTIPDACFDAFSKDGCNLLGFSSSKSATTATYTKTNRTVTTNSQSQLNLKAVWEIDPANIFSVDLKFNDNVGKVKYNKTDITTDTTITMNSVEFTNISAVDIPGYSFDHWEYTGDLSFDDGQTVQSRTLDIKAHSVATITPIYTEATYTAIWQNYDGTKLGESTNLKLNDKPQYTGATPTRPDESGFHYTFSNWNPSPSTGIKEDTTYVAQFSKTGITYQVSLDLCDGSTPQVIDVQFDASMPAIEPPTRSSYTFKGFYDQPNGQGTQYYYATGSSKRKYNKTEGCTLYAYWEGATYTVKITSAGKGSVSPTSVKVNQDISATVSATPNNGYRFNQWELDGGAYLDESYSLTDSSVKLFASAAGTATASFTPLTYNIRYETNGGTINEQSYPTQYTVGTTVKFPTDVTIESELLFGGWYKDSALTDGPVTATTVAQYGDITLYAKWNEKGVKVNITTTENKDSDNYPQSYSFYPAVVIYKCDGSVISSGYIPYGIHNLEFSITGSNLSSTSKKPFYIKSITINGEKTTYTDNKDSKTFSSYDVEQELNVEIEFSIKNYKVTYKPNGALGNAFYDIRYYDYPYTILSCEDKFIYPGKHFDHYNTNQQDTGTSVIPGDTAPSNNNNTNFNAFWEDDPPYPSNATIFAGEHGSIDIDDLTIQKGQSQQVELSNVYSKEISCTPEEGYEFDHWEVVGGILVADLSSSTTTVTAILDGSITAIYKEKTYSVVWRNCDGNVIAQSVGYKYGETPAYVGETPTYSQPGYTYTFNGWTPDFHSIEGNQEYTAQYEITPKEYTVTLELDGGTSETTSVTAKYGQILPEIDVVPTKDGFVFNGFYDQAEGGTQYYSSDCVGIKVWDKDENSTLYAQWSVRGQKIYIEQDFSACPSEVNKIDTSVILATGTSKKATDIVIDPINGTEITPGSEYYIFALFPNYPIGSTTVICSTETTISIEGKTISYSTSFNTYDGNKAYRSSSKYTFKGGEVIKIKYKWATQTMTLKQPSNQYSHGDPVTRYKYKGVAFTPPADVSSLGFYTDEGYYFTGYYWSSALHTLEYDENNSKAYISDSYTATAASLNMEARWAKLSAYDKEYRFTISFDTDSGTTFTPSQFELPEPLTDLALGQVVTLPQPTAPGCTFNGWYSKDDDVVITDNRIMAQKDITLYPSFTQNMYKVTFTSTGDVEGSCIYMTENIDSNGVYLPGGQSNRMTIKAPEGYCIQNLTDITYNYEYIHFLYDKNRKQKDVAFCIDLLLYDDLDITVKFTKRNACALSFDSSEEFIQINDVVQFEATPNQNHTEEGVITYTSSNEEVATVDNNGVVTGLIPGETTITATCSDEESSPASYTLTVEEPQLSIDDISIRFNEEYTLSSALVIGAPTGGTVSFSADPNSNVEIIESVLCTKEHASSAGKNQCYFTYSINGWTSDTVPFNVYVISPSLNTISSQVVQIGQPKSVNYSVNNNTRADSKVIDDTQYPYFTFKLDYGSEYFTVDQYNVVSTTDQALGGEVRKGQVTVYYHVNPSCVVYHTSYEVLTSQVKIKWKYDDSPMCLGETKVIATAFSPDLSHYGFVPEYKATTTSTSAAKVTINKDTGELKYTRAATNNFHANIHVDYKWPGTNQVVAQFDLNNKIQLNGVSVSSQNNYKKHVFSSTEESGDIAELSLPQVSGDGVDDPDKYEFTYSVIEGGEYTSLNGSVITPTASGLTKIKVSARLKDDTACTANSSYTFTVINDFGDTYQLECKGYSASVEGNIKAYTVWTVPKEHRNDNVYVKYSYNKKLVSKTYYVHFNEAEPDIQNNQIVYKFPCEIAAKEMSADITYGFYSSTGDLVSDEHTFNLTDNYFKPLIEGGSYYSNTIKKLMNYGAYSQIQLDFNTDNLANQYLQDEEKELTDISIVKENVEKYRGRVENQGEGISYYGSSLLAESTIKVMQYFVVDSSTEVPNCYIDGKQVTPEYAGKNSKGKIYYIQNDGCSVMNLDSSSEYKIGNMIITYSPLSYVCTVANSSSAEGPLGKAITALYEFYITLNNYYVGE